MLDAHSHRPGGGRFSAWVILLFFSLALTSPAADAQVSLPAGSSWNLGGASLNLGGSDLAVGGAFSVASGSIVNAANIDIARSGVFDNGGGALTLSGNWSNLGNFVGSGQVNFVDGPVAQSLISGDTNFANLSFVTSISKKFIFEAGSTQTIGGLLTILGSANLPIRFFSSNVGQAANINLLPSGAQNVAFVGVSNVHATGQHLAPTLSNDGGSGDALNWFLQQAANAVVAAPLSSWALLLLGLGVLAVAARSKRRLLRDTKGN